MAVTAQVYYTFASKQIAGNAPVNLFGTIRLALATSSYAVWGGHSNFSEVTNEVTGAGYTAGGEVVTGVSVSVGSGFVYVDAADVTWTSLTPDAPFRYAILYVDSGYPASSSLIGWVDFGANVDPAGSNYTVEWQDASNGGVIKLAIGA